MNTEPVECEIMKYPNGFEVLIMKDVLIWDSKDSFNIHEISNIDEMFDNLCEEGKTYHCYTQEQFNEVAKRHVRDIFEYDELFKISSFIRVFGSIFGTIISTNQDFIKLIKDTKKMPRIHPCYVGTCSHKTEIDKDDEKHITSTSIAEFEKFICWLAEFDKPQYELKIVEEEGKMEISEEVFTQLTISKVALRAIMEKHLRTILDDSISDDGKYGWNYGERANTFYWRIHKLKTMLQIGAQISFDYENQCWVWLIHTHNPSNVNMRISKDRIDLFDSKKSKYDDFSYEFMKILQGKISDYMTRLKEAYDKEDKIMPEQHKEATWFDELLHSINLGLDEFCDKVTGAPNHWTKSGTTRTIKFENRNHLGVICYTPENTYIHSIMMGVDNTPAIRIEVEEFKDNVMFNVTRGTQPPSNLFTEEEWLLMFDIIDRKMIELTKKYARKETDENRTKETLSEDPLIISKRVAERMPHNAIGTIDASNNTILLNKYDESDNEKATRWETMRDGINKTLNSFCEKIISNSIVGGRSYKRLGCLRKITLGEKTIDIILEFDTDLDSWAIFIGDITKPRILINTNGDITADISAFIPDPLCMRDIQNLCDMLGVCRNNNWQVKEDTREERMEACESSDDKEDISNLIPKEELMKIIFENVKGILENDLSENIYPWAHAQNSWSLTSYEDSFRYVIYDRQRCTSKSIGCNFDKDHWEIYIDEASNVNIVVYPDEARWMTDALLFRTPNKDFPKDTLENIIEDINAWIKTKTIPKDFEAFSQSLIKDGKRPSKIDYYLAMAEVASTRGTCLRRRFGSVIVKDDRIVSTGYVGAPSGRQNCCDIGYCFREHHKIPSGTMYEKCRSTHAEMNAIINASKEEMEGATLYLVGVEPDGSYTNADCCAMCKRVIINSGIEYVVAKQKNGMSLVIPVKEWIEHDDSLDINHKGY